jgi:hypothetical protein
MTKATFIHFYQTTRHHISEDSYPQFTALFSMYDNVALIHLACIYVSDTPRGTDDFMNWVHKTFTH